MERLCRDFDRLKLVRVLCRAAVKTDMEITDMFSYKEYKEIIQIIKESGRMANFKQARGKDQFIIMRHDVEFSVDRAFALSKLELSMDFTSTYFFQWTNNSYNILSKRNMDMIHYMHERGHEIGLHFALNGLTDMDLIRKKIMQEINVLSEMFGFEIMEFSIHRPSADVLREDIKLPGIINAYQDEYFTFAEKVTPDTKLAVKYISDAQHRWNYGRPDRETLLGNDKVQILTHPYSWTKQGYDNLDNFRTLIEERNEELLDTIDNECKHFATVRDLL